MSDVREWAAVDANNNDTQPDGWPEGMPAASVNDSGRAVMGGVRRQWQGHAWFDWSDTITRVANDQFNVVGLGTLADRYTVGKRVRITNAIGAPVTTDSYGTITGSSGDFVVTIDEQVSVINADVNLVCYLGNPGESEGAAVAQLGVHGLDARLDAIETVNTGQDNSIASNAGAIGTNNTNIANNSGRITTLEGQMTALQAEVAATKILAGTIISFGINSVPAGYLDCNGAAVSRTTFAGLFAAISTTWGVGDGSTTFNVPDLRGRLQAGQGGQSTGRLTVAGSGINGDAVAAVGGAETHLLLSAESGTKAHEHTYTRTFDQGVNDIENVVPNGTGSANLFDATAATQTTGGAAANAAQAHQNTQPTAVMKFVIKT